MKFFVDHRQKGWLKQLAIAEFVVKNKIYIAVKVLIFVVNNGRKLRNGLDIRKKRKVKKTIEFIKRMRKIYEEAEVVLRMAQKEIK